MALLVAWVLASAGALALVGTATPSAHAYGVTAQSGVPITMRDGTVLRADIYRPTNADGSPAAGPFPVIVSETPYGKQFATTPAADLTGYEPKLVQAGYVQAVVDVRGTGSSGGTFALFGPDEQADSVQVIDWASKLSGGTGKVGMLGISYDGIDQLFAAAAVGKDSPLKAIFPIVATNTPYRELATSDGLLNLESDAPLAGAYGALPLVNPFLQGSFSPSLLTDLIAHTGALTGFSAGLTTDILANGDRAYDGGFWQDRSPRRLLDQIVANGVPAYLVGGLYDVFQAGEPLNYSGLQNAWAGRSVTAPMAPDQKVTGRYQLLEKSTYHSTIQATDPPLAPIEQAWFDRWLKGVDDGIDATPTPLHVVEPDGRRLEAARYPLPEATPQSLYLGSASTLTPSAPPAGASTDTIVWTGLSGACDRSTEQFSLGVGDLLFRALTGQTDPCGAHDTPQSVAPAQLTYDAAPVPVDSTLAGPIDLRLFMSATTPDAEWVAKLSDVAPDGGAVDITQGAMLASRRALDESQTWRDAAGDPTLPWHPLTRASVAPITPGQMTRLDLDIRPTFTTLAAGHHLRLTLLTGQSPHLIPLPADLPNVLGGVYTVDRSAAAPSALIVPLAPASTLDEAAEAAGRAAGPPLRCASARRFTIHLRRGLRGASVRVAGKRVRVRHGRAVVDLRGAGKGISAVVITGRRNGHRVREVRRYHPCPHRA